MEDSQHVSEKVFSQTSEGISVQDASEASGDKTIQNVCIYFDQIWVNGINNIIFLMISHNDNFEKGGSCDINVNRYVIYYFFI